MAKGLRSSVKKTNRTKLRSRVFQPVENARLERLHAKLLEAAQAPKPDQPKKNEMEIDSAEDADADTSKDEDFPKDMEVDGASEKASSGKPKDRKAIRKARKMKGRKPKNSLTFPKTKGKGALKPHSGSKVVRRI